MFNRTERASDLSQPIITDSERPVLSDACPALPPARWPQADPRNARTTPSGRSSRSCASIRAFGFANPILIDADGGIIAGHGRLQAAKAFGLAEAPTICLPHPTLRRSARCGWPTTRSR